MISVQQNSAKIKYSAPDDVTRRMLQNCTRRHICRNQLLIKASGKSNNFTLFLSQIPYQKQSNALFLMCRWF